MEHLRSLVWDLYITGVIINRYEDEIWQLIVQTFLTKFKLKPPAVYCMSNER